MRTFATYSIKGGVGKTTAAANLAAIAARSGNRVLLWDLDPQGAATYLFRVRAKVRGGGRALITARRTLADAARGTDVPNLDLVPADFRYRHLDLVLDSVRKPTSRLRRLIEPLEDDYDWVILDCAPSISLVSEGVFDAADGLLVPIIPSALSLRTLDQLVAFLADLDGAKRSRSHDVLAFFSMVDRRRRLHKEVIETLPLARPRLVAATAIPMSSVVERMGEERAALGDFAPRARAAEAFGELWREVEARFGPVERP